MMRRRRAPYAVWSGLHSSLGSSVYVTPVGAMGRTQLGDRSAMHILAAGGREGVTDKKSRRSTDKKTRIVLRTFNPQTGMAEMCREHNLVPRTACGWKEKFLAGGRSSLEGHNASEEVRR